MFRLVSTLLLTLTTAAFAADPAVPQPPATSIRVECYGLLRHGVVAKGGETTGTTIGFDRMRWELHLPNEAARKFAADHHEKHVVAIGSLRRVTGVEISERWIVDVEQLTERPAGSQRVGATATIAGKLTLGEKVSVEKQSGEKAEKTAELRIEANGITFPLTFGEDKALAEKAKGLVGKQVVLTGLVDRIQGTKGPLRMEIHVSKLDLPVAEKPKARS